MRLGLMILLSVLAVVGAVSVVGATIGSATDHEPIEPIVVERPPPGSQVPQPVLQAPGPGSPVPTPSGHNERPYSPPAPAVTKDVPAPPPPVGTDDDWDDDWDDD